MSGGAGKVVAVTGASGYIASWLVKLLLQRGYTVNATVRNLHDASKTEHLLALDGAKERLHLFEADLIEEGSFDSVVDGCHGVFHTASPVLFSVADPQRELIDPAVKGTLNVLKSCTKVPSIRRVVITSSMASVTRNTIPLIPGVVVDETWFSDVVHCEQTKQWYALSKTLAEDAAWNFSKENGIDLVVLHPCSTIGPLLQPTLNFASEGILNFIENGKGLDSNEIYRCVDVRDVARAHIFAFELPSADGRYCLVGTVLYFSEVLQILHKIYPALSGFERREDHTPLPSPYEVSKERAKSLGVEFTSFEVSLGDSIESLRENKFVNF